MKLFQKMIALVMALCLVCAAGMALAEDTLVDKIKAKGVLSVGTEAITSTVSRPPSTMPNAAYWPSR